MDQKLKGLGRNSAVEFNAKLLKLMEQRETNGTVESKTAGAAAPKIEKEIPIMNRLGLHARPAAMFVRIASRYRARSGCEGRRSQRQEHHGLDDAGRRAGLEVAVRCEGPDADKAMRESKS